MERSLAGRAKRSKSFRRLVVRRSSERHSRPTGTGANAITSSRSVLSFDVGCSQDRLIARPRRRLAHELENTACCHFIGPCLPSPADKPPSGSNWIHEIKHDGYRLMVRRDPVGIRLLTRNGNDWSARFPLVVEAVNHLNVRSCLIDGEVVCCDERGLAIFSTLRQRRNEARAFLFAFDLLEMDGLDMRREPIETRKATLASLLRRAAWDASERAHSAPQRRRRVSSVCKLGAEGIVSKRLGSRYRSGRSPDWLKFKNPEARP